jgi:hypothetical protein
METLVLTAVEVINEDNWRWLLADSSGNPIADHQVALKPTRFEYQGYVDLPGYLAWNSPPDQRASSEAQLLDQLGEWMGRNVFGAVGRAIAAGAPVIVRVVLPDELAVILHRPLAIAQVDGIPLATRANLVFEIAGDYRPYPKEPVTGRLRVLAVFGLPTESSAGSLRHERYRLSGLIQSVSARHGAAVELRVLQYGVTRDQVGAVLEEGAGWDIIHLSGHGIAAGSGIVLERPDGSPDVLGGDELIRLLRHGRSQLKLVVISHNQPANASMAETRRALGFGDSVDRETKHASQTGVGMPLSELGLRLAQRLDCVVLAARYPLADQATLTFNDHFYGHLLGDAEDVVAATSAALAAVADDAHDEAARLQALASPILIGPRAIGLVLSPPKQEHPKRYDQADRLTYFPSEPERFVGRNSVMARASTALAPESGYRCVMLYGLIGIGTTACALELAYRHADAFQWLVWWHAPAGEDHAAALASLGTALESQLAGFSFPTAIADINIYRRQLRDLTSLLEEIAMLVVLDGLESLLSSDGEWRDPRWKELIGTLASHHGQSRTILASSIPPSTDDSSRILAIPVPALSLDETIMLAEELPNLRNLLHISAGSFHAPTTEVGAVTDRDRELVRRTLRVVQGHPKLLELADAAASDPERLDTQLDAAEQAAAGLSLDAFFRDGDSTLDPGQFLDALTGWTTNALDVLSEPTQLIAKFIAYLEDPDRRSDIIEANWADLWRRLDQPGEAPAPGPMVDALSRAALVQSEGGTPVTYRMHPGVAAAITAGSTPGIRDAADTELAAFWVTVCRRAREREDGEDSGSVVAAGRAPPPDILRHPHLLRLTDWDTAANLLEDALMRDRSPGVVATALPALRRIATASGTPVHQAILARALWFAGQAEAGPLLRDTLQAAVGAGDYRLAAAIAGDLADLLREAGRLGEALEVAEQKVGYTEQAGLGPWTQLLDQARRLQILAAMGEHERVLAETTILGVQMGRLPARLGASETVQSWNVRETILDIGHTSALALGRWQQCLDLNAEITTSTQERGAGLHEFEDHRDTPMLATVLSTRAGLENASGRPGAAADLARTAIRLRYARPDPRDIAISHHNLAGYLREAGGNLAGQRAHRLAAALIFRLTGMTHYLATTQRALAADHHVDIGGGDALPGTLAEVIRIAERTDGVRLGELLAALQPDAQIAEQALAEILRAAAEQPPGETDITGYLRQWEPVISSIVAAYGGDEDAMTPLLAFLDEQATTQDWAALVSVLRRILDGERGEDLLDGLDPIDTAITREMLRRLTGTTLLVPSINEQWHPIVTEIVAAASGQREISAEFSLRLDQLADTSDWAALVTVLRRILAGERDPDRLTADLRSLDDVDSAIVEEVLAGLPGQHGEHLEAWRVRRLSEETLRSADEIL